jgi:hypothetical protein
MRHGSKRESWKYISIDSAKPGFRAPSTPCSAHAPFCYTSSMLVLYINIINPSFISLLPPPHISFLNAPQYNNAVFVLFLFFDSTSCVNPVTRSSSPTLFNYLITMHKIITNTPNIVPQLQQAALSEILKLQQATLYEISQLHLPRQQVLEMEVQLRVPNLEALCDGYVNQDTCQLSWNFKLSKARIYFPTKYTPDKKGRQALYHDIRRAAQDGGDSLTLWGKGRGKE